MIARPTLLALGAALLAIGCINPLYPCQTDADCNVGSNGRCEPNHECTIYDPSCPVERVYTEYSGSDSGLCFDDSVDPLNKCTGGQPPAPANSTDACVQMVCSDYLPSCCSSGWTDACVQLAQVHCVLKCNFNIALIAASGPNLLSSGQTIQLWDLRFNTSTFEGGERLDDLSGSNAAMFRTGFLEWLAPAPGDTAPRLAGLDGSGNLLVGEGSATSTIPLPAVPQTTPVSSYNGIASIDFDRDGYDTAVLSGGNATGGSVYAVKLGSGATRLLAAGSPSLPLETWGDPDGTPFPGAAAASGDGAAYRYLYNAEPTGTDARTIQYSDGGTMSAGDNPTVRDFDWGDLNLDMHDDLVAFGAAIQVHLGMEPSPLANTPAPRIVCNPPRLAGGSACATVGFAGGLEVQPGNETNIVASLVDTTVVGSGSTATEPNHVITVYRLHYDFSNSAIDQSTMFTLSDPTRCANPCAIESVVVRDFDQDGVMDVLGIDSNLNLWMGLSGSNNNKPPTELDLVTPGIGSPSVSFPILRTSVSGTVAP